MKVQAFICLVCVWCRVCIASSPRLLYANRKDIRILRTANHEGKNETTVVDGLEDAIALDYYYQGQYVFWTDVSLEKIKRTHLGNRKTELVASFGLMRPEGLAVDWIGKKLYWTDSETNRIEVSNLDGSFRKLLFWKNVDQPRAISLDPLSGFMFWTDWGETPKIERADMDSANRTLLIEKNIYWPNGLTIDYKDKKIYWTDAKLNYIARIQYDGSNRQTILQGTLPHPFALSLFNNRLYWTDWTTRSIHTCNKNTGHGETIVYSKIFSPMGIQVFEASVQRTPAGSDKCGEDNGGCSHLCLLSPGGQTCSCPTGIRLMSDGKTCERGPHKFILLVRRTDIRRISLDTIDHTDVVLPLTGIRHAVALDFDPVDKYVYWTDDERPEIKRARMDGTGVEVLASVEVQHPDGIAVDWVARNLYWTDTGIDRIEVCRLNGSSRRVLVSAGLDEPRAIVLDPSNGYMYWTDWGKEPKIEKAELDGTNRRVIVNTSIYWPNGLAIDYKARRIYWADAKLDKIEVMKYDGTGRRTILEKDVPHVFGFSIIGDHVYWSDWQKRAVYVVDKENGKNRQTIVENLPDLMGLKAVDSSMKYGSNPCRHKNGGCSHLCLYKPTGVHCDCPTGMELIRNNKTCIVPKAFLLFSWSHQKIGRIPLDTYNGDKVIPLVGVKEANALDFSVKDMRIYWTDLTLKSISRAFMNGSNNEHVVSVGLQYPDGLAVDWIGNNLFWTDSKTHRIEVSKLDGRHRKTLLWENVWEPRSITVDPEQGQMYWTVGGANPQIERAHMDGTNRTVIITDLKRPNGLTIDFKERLLYWVDAENNLIECANLDGTNRTAVVKMPKNNAKPYGLTLFEDFIYWSDWMLNSIERANKTTGLNRTRIQDRVEFIMDILVFHASRQSGWNKCGLNNGGCSHLCLAKPANQRTCACPTHYTLLSDNKSCAEPKSFLLISTSKDIRQVTFDNPADKPDVILPMNHLNDVTAIDYDVRTDFLYWIDGKTNDIKRSYINGTHGEALNVSGDQKVKANPYDLAVDPYGAQLFWTDKDKNAIMAFSLKSKKPLGVVFGVDGERPRSLVLYPEKGLMFWTDMADRPSIKRAKMNGEDATKVVTMAIKSPGDLAIDTIEEKLYWTDTELKRIEWSDLSGKQQKVLVDQNVLQPVGLAVHGDYVYWIDSKPMNVMRVTKSGRGKLPIQAKVDKLTDLVAVNRTKKTATHPCLINNCSHICRVDSTGKKHLCSCPMGMYLNNNKCGQPPSCPPDKYSCIKSHMCIPITWHCDGSDDCGDGSDELNCPTCQPSEFRCKSGQCIRNVSRCDDNDDCVDGSDEKECTTCSSDKFTCKNGRCIPQSWRCDELDDCGDGSDERNCMNSKNGTDFYPGRKNEILNPKMVGGIVSSIIVCMFIFAVGLLIWRRLKRGPDTSVSHEIGLVITPVTHGHAPSSGSSISSHGSICASVPLRSDLAVSARRPKSLPSTSNKSGTVYDRNNLTGQSSSSSASTVVSAYPREPLNPPPSPVTERSQYTIRSRVCPSSMMTPSTCQSYRYQRARMPPPPTPASTDAESLMDRSIAEHYCRRGPHRCRSASSRFSESTCTELGYDSDLFAPPPTPNTNYLSEATHFSDGECPPSPTATERSYFNPYPPPPSPVTDTPSLV